MRSDHRPANDLRATTLTPDYLMHAEGSVLIEAGHTKVICTASVEDRVPGFLRNTGKGWVTAEYGMLPRATSTRSAIARPNPRLTPVSTILFDSIAAFYTDLRDLTWRGKRWATLTSPKR